jgi:hypothetical protein
MPEQEFELYLSALAKRLRLSSKQKTEIAAELRDQLESRFQSLIDAGLSREEAIRKALEDCGDGTVLARELAGVQRIVRRRRLVRIGLVGAGIAALVLLAVRWELAVLERADRQFASSVPPAKVKGYYPQDVPPNDWAALSRMNGSGNRAMVLVQDSGTGQIRSEPVLLGDGAAAAPVPQAAVQPTPAEKLERAVEERLEQLWDKDVAFDGIPLAEAVSVVVREEAGLPLVIRRSLGEQFESDLKVTLNLPKGSVSLRSLLDLLLEQAGIEGATIVVQDGILVVTDVESAKRVEVYPIGHLLISGPITAGMGPGSSAGGLGSGMSGGMDGMLGGPPPVISAPAYSESGTGVALPATEGTSRSRPIYAGPDAVGLVRAIVANIEGDWQTEGGSDSISEVNGLLVVRADTRTHRRLQELLRKLAAARQPATALPPTPQ